MKIEEYIHGLREYFEKRSDVVMAFVFGSQAKERGHSGSDWDIAVYFTPISEILEWEEENREYPEENRIWPDVLRWLQSEPDTTAKDLFKRLQESHPGRFTDSQLRTLQRHVKEWRQIMSKKLVHSCLNVNTEYDKIVPIGVNT